MKSPYTFEKNGWLKRQNPKHCSAHDYLRLARDLTGSLERATTMFILDIDQTHSLAVLSDFSCLLSQKLPSGFYQHYPDALRLKRRKGATTLITTNKNLYSTRKILRVQIANGPTEEAYELDPNHPFLIDLKEEAKTLLQTTTFAPLHTDWKTWNTTNTRCWQTPVLSNDDMLTLQHKISYLAKAIGFTRFPVIKCPHHKFGTLNPFADGNPYQTEKEKISLLLSCLNDHKFGRLEDYANDHQGNPVSIRSRNNDPQPAISAHALMTLEILAQEHTSIEV